MHRGLSFMAPSWGWTPRLLAHLLAGSGRPTPRLFLNNSEGRLLQLLPGADARMPFGPGLYSKGPPAWAPRSGHVEPLLSRFVREPGLKVLGFSPDPLVPVPEPGLKALPTIMTLLLESSEDVSNVAKNVCGAICCLAQGYEDAESSSSVLTPYLPNVITALLCASDRAGTTHLSLRASAFEALSEVVRVSNIAETSSIIGQPCQEIMQRLNLTFDLQILSPGDREKQSDQHALLCGVLQVIIQKLSNSDAISVIAQTADQLMLLFLRVFACPSSTAHEKAMLAIRDVAYAIGQDFVKYMPDFFKYLEAGLQNYEEYQICSISVWVVGDISRAIEDKILAFCDCIMTILSKDLANSMLHRSVRPSIFSCLGDIALAIGDNFEKHLPYAMPALQGAAELVVLDQSDEDTIVHHNQLRHGIFEAYSGILQGMKGPKAELMLPYASHLLQFTDAVYKDPSRDESVTKDVVAVLGDLASILGPISNDLFKIHPFHAELLSECLNSDNELREIALWSRE